MRCRRSPQLCTDLGDPAPPSREAVRTLVALDIVEVRHGHGMFVGKVSMSPMVESLVFKGLLNPGDDHRGLRDIVEVRITLDNALAEPVTHAWNNRQDPELDTIVDKIEHLASQGELFTDQDRRFHTRLLEPLDNRLYLHLTEAFWAIHTLTVPLLDAPQARRPHQHRQSPPSHAPSRPRRRHPRLPQSHHRPLRPTPSRPHLRRTTKDPCGAFPTQHNGAPTTRNGSWGLRAAFLNAVFAWYRYRALTGILRWKLMCWWGSGCTCRTHPGARPPTAGGAVCVRRRCDRNRLEHHSAGCLVS